MVLLAFNSCRENIFLTKKALKKYFVIKKTFFNKKKEIKEIFLNIKFLTKKTFLTNKKNINKSKIFINK